MTKTEMREIAQRRYETAKRNYEGNRDGRRDYDIGYDAGQKVAYSAVLADLAMLDDDRSEEMIEWVENAYKKAKTESYLIFPLLNEEYRKQCAIAAVLHEFLQKFTKTHCPHCGQVLHD